MFCPQPIEESLQQLHTASITDIQQKMFHSGPSLSSASPLHRLSASQLDALRCCVEQAILGSIQCMKETPHDAMRQEIKAQVDYFMLACDTGRVQLSTSSGPICPPVALAVVQSDQACDTVTAAATAFVCNTLSLDPKDVLEQVASAVGEYLHASQPSEHAVDRHCFPIQEVVQRIQDSPNAHAWCSHMQEHPFSAEFGEG